MLAVWGILGLLLIREFAESAAPRYSAVAIGVLVIAAVLAFAAINLDKAAR